MAFDMFTLKDYAMIDHHEEELFELIDFDDDYPQLNVIWENFYKGSRILPNAANEIVHELIDLRKGLNKQGVVHTIDRLLPFFSKAYRNNEIITCVSD